MKPGPNTSRAATAAATSVGAILAATALTAEGALIGDLLDGTIVAAFEGAGVMLFVAALIAAPVYAKTARRHDDLADSPAAGAENSRRW